MTSPEETSQLKVGKDSVKMPQWLIVVLISLAVSAGGILAETRFKLSAIDSAVAAQGVVLDAHKAEEGHPAMVVYRINQLEGRLSKTEADVGGALREVQQTLSRISENQIRLCEKQRVNCAGR